MAEVIGVRFKNMGKVYYFDPEEYELKIGDNVIVETARGVECGEVAMERKEIAEEDIVQPLKKLIRIATPDDLKKVAENAIKEKTAFDICVKKIAAHKLEMKLVNVEYTFDNSKILFYFTADGRVDFRELVKDLASVFRTRIELRQIGVRDEAKMLGGLGICGRPFCCSSFLSGFQPVSIKMAKEQGLSLNPVKISGTCGRLMCCLKYEQEAYADLLRRTPAVNSIVMTPAGKGVVVDQNIITGNFAGALGFCAGGRAADLPCEAGEAAAREGRCGKERSGSGAGGYRGGRCAGSGARPGGRKAGEAGAQGASGGEEAPAGGKFGRAPRTAAEGPREAPAAAGRQGVGTPGASPEAGRTPAARPRRTRKAGRGGTAPAPGAQRE